MNNATSGAFARMAWAAWKALLVLDVVGLLAVAAYAALASPQDGPGATPLLMAGLLSLCVVVLAVVSAVAAALWARAAGWPWWRSLVLAVLALLSAVLVFLMAVYASDPGQPGAIRWGALLLLVLSTLGAYVFNAHAVRRFRRRR